MKGFPITKIDIYFSGFHILPNPYTFPTSYLCKKKKKNKNAECIHVWVGGSGKVLNYVPQNANTWQKYIIFNPKNMRYSFNLKLI